MRLLNVEAPDVPERQQSLEAAVGWSYDLLSESEQRLFRCLGVFVGRVTLDAIAAVDNEVQGKEQRASRKTQAMEKRQAVHFNCCSRSLRRVSSCQCDPRSRVD